MIRFEVPGPTPTPKDFTLPSPFTNLLPIPSRLPRLVSLHLVLTLSSVLSQISLSRTTHLTPARRFGSEPDTETLRR